MAAATRKPADEDEDTHNPFGGGGEDKPSKSTPSPPNETFDPFEPTPGEREDDFMHDLEDGRGKGTRDA